MIVSTATPRDREVYTSPGFSPAWVQATDEAFVQGPHGYAADTTMAMRPWDIALSTIEGAVDIWYGADDTAHSPDHGAALSERIPTARRHVVPDAGGAILWTHGATVLRQLLNYGRAGNHR